MALEQHTHDTTGGNHIAALEYCLEQAKAAAKSTRSELMTLAYDFEHCNTSVVTWLLNLMLQKEEL